MRFSAEKDTILNSLAFVTKYAGEAKSIPIIGSVLIEADEGGVRVAATNIDRSASDRFSADIAEAGAACLPAQLLLKSIRSTVGSEVAVDAGDRQAIVSVGRSRFTLPVLPATNFPPMPTLTADALCTFPIAGSALHYIEKAVTFAHEPDGGRYYLVGTSWQATDGKLELCATDGKRMSVLSTDIEALDLPPVIVPVFGLPQWGDEVEVSASEKFIRFRSGNQVVASNLVEGSYPDYSRLVPSNPNAIRFNRADLLSSVNRAALVADRGEHSILIVGRDGIASISAISVNGEVSDEVEFDGPDFQCAHTHELLVSTLSSFDCETIEMRWADHVTGGTLHDPEDAARVVLVVPYRDSRLAEFVQPIREAAE